MEKIVFTNGCFDILHPGHVDLLARARSLGTKLVVGINSDESVRAIKGTPRPFCAERDRKAVLMGLAAVDEVRVFSEPTPERLIREIAPDVLVKGGDWRLSEIVGADFVLEKGGEVYSLPLKEGFSSSEIVEKILRSGEKTIRANRTLRRGDRLPGETAGIEDILSGLAVTFEKLSADCLPEVEKCADLLRLTRKEGKKTLFAFEGIGSSLASHFVFEENPVRQTNETEPSPGDLFVALSIDGASPDILDVLMKARRAECRTLALTGRNGKKLASVCDASVLIPSEVASEIRAAQVALFAVLRGFSEAERISK